MIDETTISQHPAELLQQLVRFDTSNPPGNEAECIGYIDRLLTGAGIPTCILAKEPGRPNLIARLPGRGNAPPLMLYAHIDVVPTENQTWQVPPFEGRVVDGTLWGRGCLDDKGGAAMSLSAFLRARAEGFAPPGDVVLVMLCDEEAGGGLGSKYLVENHADQFTGIRYALGEVGGFAFYLGGRRFYPIMISEKRWCVLQLSVHAPSYHGAALMARGGLAARAGGLLTRLDHARMPVHVCPAARQLFEIMSANVPFPASLVIRQLLNPALADRVLDLLGPSGQALYPLLHNTYNLMFIRGGEEYGPIPTQMTTRLGAYLLPGCSPDDLVRELRLAVGGEVDFEICDTGDPIPDQADMGLFDTLCAILRECDPQGVPAPLLLTTPTDARIFDRLGIQTYGFQPMNLPPDVEIAKLAHAADERIPVKAVEFGAEAIYRVLHRFGEEK